MSEPILYASTNGRCAPVRFRDALLEGIAPDGGLFMPQRIPRLSPGDVDALSGLPYADVAYAVMRPFLATELPEPELRRIVADAYDFPVPLERVHDRTHVMRLDQGPTASFKDFAARMMGRLIHHFLREERRRLTILTATSGDTGSAIANAFHGLDAVSIVVLFPREEVTDRQRRQMTTLGGNVTVVAVDGKFDDCQALVKRAFTDPALADLPLSSANSINIGRLVPQIVYYVYAWAQLRRRGDRGMVVSVPSGNFGDMMGGCFARAMGLPIDTFVIATNENDEFPVYLSTGEYRKVEPSRNCISSAMNVGHPSNLARLVALYGGEMDETGAIHRQADLAAMRRDLHGVSISDAETKNAIRSAHELHGILLEPHGAVGWAGLERFRRATPDRDWSEQLAVSIETAHPAKFPEQIRSILSSDPPLPPSLQGLDERSEHVTCMDNDYAAFTEFLLRLSREQT
jgi:threonine synthase